MSKPAEWFKIWMVIIMKCNYEDNWIYKRGEIITKYENLAIECGVSRNTIKSFIDWARGATLVTPQQLKRGVKIKVNNYDKYQGWMTPSTPPTMLPSTPAINKGIQKDRKTEIDTNTDDVYTQAWHLSITHDEFTKLEKEFWMEKADELVQSVLNYRKNSKYKSLYLTAKKWWRDEKKKAEEPIKKVVRTFNHNEQ